MRTFGSREPTGSLSISLRAEPRDLAVSVHPIVNVGLALETRDFSWFGAWVLSDHSPVIIRVTNRSEGHFCFCHAVLCGERLQKGTSPEKKVRASLKIAVTLQRRDFARTLQQDIDFAILSYFFFPHQPSLAREQGCHAEAIWRRRALDPRATARQAIRLRTEALGDSLPLPQPSAIFFKVARKLRLRFPTSVVPNTSAWSSANVPENPLVTSCPPNSGRTNGSEKDVC
jgi:hypothetical protein